MGLKDDLWEELDLTDEFQEEEEEEEEIDDDSSGEMTIDDYDMDFYADEMRDAGDDPEDDDDAY